MRKQQEERLEGFIKKVAHYEKMETQFLKLKQEILNLERENSELKKTDKVLRKEYLERAKQIEKDNLKKVRVKNKQIEE